MRTEFKKQIQMIRLGMEYDDLDMVKKYCRELIDQTKEELKVYGK